MGKRGTETEFELTTIERLQLQRYDYQHVGGRVARGAAEIKQTDPPVVHG